jgi:hypothetical protein
MILQNLWVLFIALTMINIAVAWVFTIYIDQKSIEISDRIGKFFSAPKEAHKKRDALEASL